MGRKARGIMQNQQGLSMILVLIAREGFMFLIVWEIMALSSFILQGTPGNIMPIMRIFEIN